MRVTGSAGGDPEVEAKLALARGDRGCALDVLMTAYGRMAYRYCCRILLDSNLADDVLQITFLQAFEDLERFDGRSTLRTWLFGISHHRCLDAIKERRRRQQRLDDLDVARQVADPSMGVDEAAAANQRSRALKACLEQLPTRIREVVLLRYELGFSYPEIATICKKRAPTLQARVARALPELRRCLDVKGVGV